MENKKKFSFNYDLSALPTYNSYGSDMLIKSILGLTLPKYSTIRPNLKGTTEKVGFVTNDVVLQDLSCGFDPTGDTVQNLVTIDLCNKKVNQQLCPYDLYDTYLSQSLTNANFQESVPFEETILTDISNRISNNVEKQLFLNATGGSSLGGASYTGACFNGVGATITEANGANRIAYSAATASNGLDVFTAIYEAIPSNVLHRDDLVIYCSYSNYRGLVSSMRNSSYVNLFTMDAAGAAAGEEWSLILPGTNVRVIPTVGLEGISAYFAGPAGYHMVGMNAEMMTVKSVYDPFEDIVKIQAHVSYGYGAFDPASFCLCQGA
jgi:hypothetical protein